MRFSDSDRRIFHCAELDARASVAALRGVCGRRDHTIRYCLSRAREEGIITPRCFVDLGKLGISQYEIYFSFSSENARSRKDLLKALCGSERVTWAGELGGDFQYGVNICARNAKDLSDFLDELSRKYGEIFLEKQIASRVSLDYYGCKYLSKSAKPRAGLSSSSTDDVVRIDELDHKILKCIMDISYDSAQIIAQKLGVPRSSVEFRIKRLEEKGVIAGYYYIFDTAKIGAQSFLLLVGTKSVSHELREQLREFCAGHPNALFLIYSIGAWDFEIGVDVEDAKKITEITSELHGTVGRHLRFIRVLPSFQYTKVMEYPFRDFELVKKLAPAR